MPNRREKKFLLARALEAQRILGMSFPESENKYGFSKPSVVFSGHIARLYFLKTEKPYKLLNGAKENRNKSVIFFFCTLEELCSTANILKLQQLFPDTPTWQ